MKIGSGKFQSLEIVSPKTDLRPTQGKVKDSLSNILRSNYLDFIQDKKVLELFAGSGQIGFELLSLGANSITMIEKNKANAKCISKTIENHKFKDKVTVQVRDAYRYNPITMFDTLFLDPPYNHTPNELSKLLDKISSKITSLIILETDSSFSQIEINGFKLDQRKDFGTTTLWFYLKVVS